MENKNIKPKGTFAKLMQSTPLSPQQSPTQPVIKEVKKTPNIEITTKKNESSLERTSVRTKEQKKERT